MTNADDADNATDGAVVRKSKAKPGERRMAILQAFAAMLEQPMAERVTTAALAKRLDVSEAALYRQFASKAQMLDALITFTEDSLLGLAGKVGEPGAVGLDGREACRRWFCYRCNLRRPIRAWCACWLAMPWCLSKPVLPSA